MMQGTGPKATFCFSCESVPPVGRGGVKGAWVIFLLHFYVFDGQVRAILGYADQRNDSSKNAATKT
jgi:hypothetical protein